MERTGRIALFPVFCQKDHHPDRVLSGFLKAHKCYPRVGYLFRIIIHHESKKDKRSALIKPDESDMFDVEPIQPQGLATMAPETSKAFVSGPPPVPKAILADMDKKRRQTPPPIPADALNRTVYDIPRGEGTNVPAYAEYKVKRTNNQKGINEDPMYGYAPLPDDSILRPKPPAIPADAIPSTYDIPRGEGSETPPEYASITDDRMPKVGPPPIPAMADVPKEKPKKKSLFARAKKWLLG